MAINFDDIISTLPPTDKGIAIMENIDAHLLELTRQVAIIATTQKMQSESYGKSFNEIKEDIKEIKNQIEIDKARTSLDLIDLLRDHGWKIGLAAFLIFSGTEIHHYLPLVKKILGAD